MMAANYRGIRKRDADAMLLAQRWSKVAAVLFAVGAVSGTVPTFELGLLFLTAEAESHRDVELEASPLPARPPGRAPRPR
jgi:hypothetical protein